MLYFVFCIIFTPKLPHLCGLAAVWTPKQEQRLEEAILVAATPFPSYQHGACLLKRSGKRMWLQVRARDTDAAD